MNKLKFIFGGYILKKESVRKLEIFLIIAFVFCTIFVLNYYTQYTSDDYRYHYFFDSYMPSDTTRLLNGIFDIPASMFNHYNIWGGRIFAHSIVQFFMLFDKNVFNIFNSLIYLLMGIVIYKHIFPVCKKYSPFWLIYIYLFMWIFIPTFGLSVLWVSGAGNYIWMIFFILLFLLPYRKHEFFYDKDNDSIFKVIGMFVFGIFSGITNENSSGAMIMSQIMFIIYWKYKNILIPKWSISGLISSSIGLIFMVMSPGNNVRQYIEGNLEGDIFDRFIKILKISTISFSVLGILFLIGLIYIVKKYKFDFLKEKAFIICIYFIPAVASDIVLVASPTIAYRSLFLPVIFLIVLIGIIYCQIIENKINKSISYIILCLIFVFGSYRYVSAYYDIKKTYNEVEIEISQIEEQKNRGILDVTVDRFEDAESMYNAFWGSANLGEDRNSWFNSWMAEYYGVNSIGIK